MPEQGAQAAASDSTQYRAPVGVGDLVVHPLGDAPIKPLNRSKESWQEVVSGDAYAVLFREATERPFTSPLLKESRRGTFICAACRLPLFPSTTKYESGTGWPSFWAPLPNRIDTKEDRKLGTLRIEYHCARCGGHQGHVFHDGPDPTGLRYCNNGVALAFVPEGEALPALRE